MYLVSAYFDNHTNKILARYMEEIARKTGNHFMTENEVPPHLTISSAEARSGEILLPFIQQLQGTLKQGEVRFVSVGMLFPYVMYVTPVMNSYLLELSTKVYDSICSIPEVSVSKYYRPLQWLPHVTLGKKLTKEQMRVAFEIMQEKFIPFTGKITEIGLAKVNPHEDLLRFEL